MSKWSPEPVDSMNGNVSVWDQIAGGDGGLTMKLGLMVVLCGLLLACSPDQEMLRHFVDMRVAALTGIEVNEEDPVPSRRYKTKEGAQDAAATGAAVETEGAGSVEQVQAEEVNPYKRISQHQDATLDNVLQGHRFTQQLRKMMEGYEPKLPQMPSTDLMRCTTKEERTSSVDLESLYKSFEKEQKDSEKERKELKKEFYKRIYPIQFRIDHDWAQRTGIKEVVTHGCYWGDGEWGSETKGSCRRDGGRFKVRSRKWVDEPTINLYSRKGAPAQPELMQRMAKQKIEVPERQYCLVREVDRETEKTYGCYWGDGDWGRESKRACRSEDGRWKVRKTEPGGTVSIDCSAPDATSSFSIVAEHRASTGISRGDVVSVPLKGVKGVEKGVVAANFDTDGWSIIPEFKSWSVRVTGGSLKKEVPNADCPKPREIAAAICRTYDKRSDKQTAISKCTEGKVASKLTELAAIWQKARFDNKTQVMIKAYASIVKMAPENKAAQERLESYRAQPAKSK
jgi:hypothetical protein